LGNPGPRYASTRHNVGFRIVERFAEAHDIALASRRLGWLFRRRIRGRFGCGTVAAPEGRTVEVGVLAPGTYMNLSGEAVLEALRLFPVGDVSQDLLVALDDVDLPFGRLRLRPGGGSAGHKGLAHVTLRLGRSDFPRLRFGVGRPPGSLDTTDHVLEPFSPDQERVLDDRIGVAVEAIEAALVEGVAAAMNRYNREPAP
jgi:PTH1 family peptidyl-tRNA hydrolase